ncbi:unnamed protein product [Caenorhabditis brenneri]
MQTRWRYYNSKRGGNGFRGRGRGRGRGTSLTAISLPREDYLHREDQNDAYNRDKPMNPKEYRDETVLSLSFAQNMLGAAYYEQSTQLVKVMNDISEDHEFVFLKRLIEDVKPTMIIVNRSQDLEFIKMLSSRYAQHEKLQIDANDKETTQETIPTWDASLAYSTDETSLQNENEDDDDEAFDGPPAMLYKLTNNFYKMPRALQRLKLMVGAEDSSMSDEDRYTIVTMRFDIEAVNMVRSFGALLLFLDETRLGVEKEPLSVTPPIKSIKTLTLENLVDIDYNTIQALDILPKELESKKSLGKNSSLFSLVDRCRSTVGKKCLRKWFRNPTTDREVLVSRQKCVHYFKQDWNAEVTAKVAAILGKVKGLNNVFQRFQSGTAKLIHWECFVSTVNALLEIISIVRQTPITDELHVETTLLKEVSEVAIIAGSIINFAESKIQGRVTVMPGIDEDLDRLRDTYENMPMVLTGIAKQESIRLGLQSHHDVSCVYIPLVGFVLSLPREFPAETHSDMSLVYATSEELRVRNETTERLDNEYGDILMKLIDNQTAIILALKMRVMKKKRSIIKLLSVAARIDALLALGLIAAENGWNCPTLVDEPIIEALELYHPLSVLVVKKNFVPNPVSSGRNGIKASIITGPNACGKSVYMKSIGILAFLTHIGSFVPARHAKVGLVDRIVTRMFTVDSVLDGMSTFAKDVEQVALALRKATGNSLVIIDEFGKGTMTEVGLSLLAACMTHWMEKGPERCPHIFLSSHFHSLPKYIPVHLNISTLLTFTVLRESGGKIKYLFRLTPGTVDCSFAMSVARDEGIPMPVLGRACRIYKALKSGTPLKEVRAEVSSDNEEQLIVDMDIVIEDDDNWMSAVESFVKRDKRAADSCHSNSNSSNKSSKESYEKESEEREELLTSISNRRPETEGRSRTRSVISSKSVSSIDHLSVFDALLPEREKKKVVLEEEEESTMESSRSPDPFSVDEEEKEYGSDNSEDGEEDPVVRKRLIPRLQKLGSEEEKEQSSSSARESTSSRSVISNIFDCTPNIPKQEERFGIKRPRSPSTSKISSSRKTPWPTARSTQANLDSQVPETPIQAPQKRSTKTFLESQLPPPKKMVIPCSQDSMFKTPTMIRSDAKSRNSIDITPSERSNNHRLMETHRENNVDQSTSKTMHEGCNNSFNFIEDSIRKSQNVLDPITTPRSSSRRDIRPEDLIMGTQTPKSSGKIHSSYSPVGSRFSIFDSQQSFPGLMTQDSSNDVSFFFETQKTNKNFDEPKEKQKGIFTQTFGFQTPKAKSSGKQSSFMKQSNQSRKSVSPSSIILGDLVQDDIEKTPLPLGDKSPCADFNFNIHDDDPIYGKNQRRSPEFDFMKSKDDDDPFLKSFLDSQQSLRIDTSSDISARFEKNKF